MKNVIPALVAAFIATTAPISAAQAAVIDFGIVALGGHMGFTGTTLDKSSAFDLDSALLSVSQVLPGDASGLAIGNLVTVHNVPPPTGSMIMYGSGPVPVGGRPLVADLIKMWTATKGPDKGDVFTETLDTVTDINRATGNAITVTLTGFLDGPGFVNAPVEMIFGANQVGGPGHVISVALTNASTTVIPEPSTWVMMGLGFIGLGYTAVRRRSKDRSALAI